MKYYFDSTYGEQPIITGYIGAIVIVLCSFTIEFLKLEGVELFGLRFQRNDLLMLMIVSTMLTMLIAELFGKRRYILNGWMKVEKTKIKITSFHLIISTLYRFSTLLLVFYLMFFILNKHYYFSDQSFQITKCFFSYFFSAYFILGLPYIFLTLKYKWSYKYEINDYSINLILIFKGLTYFVCGRLFNKKIFRRGKIILSSKRVKKISLTYLVIFFFLTLMIKFLGIEFEQFNQAISLLNSLNNNSRFFERYNAWYLIIYHLLFIVDVSLAIIGYTFVSRWLDNRTRSVDMTLGGWMVAIMCYPPMNSGFTEQFINYNAGQSHNVITSEAGKIFIMFITLLLVTIYVWATVAFSFKFSNLTNRGIVSTGPYSVVRHPAYISKNLSWWLTNSFVLSNFWAVIALLGWNTIYILRALTEERHLKKDPKYQEYCKKVKYRFIPGLI